MKRSFCVFIAVWVTLVSCSPTRNSVPNEYESPSPSSVDGTLPPYSNSSSPLKYEEIIYENGWIISERVEIKNKIITVKGDLIIAKLGSLELTSSTIIMKNVGENTPRIEVENGGNITIEDSTITAFSADIGYTFVIGKGASGKIEQSIIEYFSPNDMSFGEGVVHEHANMGGLTILADGFILRNSVVRNGSNQARAILVAEVDDVVIEGNMIYNNPNDGIRLVDCKNVTIRNNMVLNNSTYGVKFMNCKDSQVVGNTIEGNPFSKNSDIGAGLFLEFGTTNIVVKNNVISNSGRHAIVIPQSNNNIVDSNLIIGNNGYGMYIYGGSSDNLITNNILYDNRLEGIYREEGTKNNNVQGNQISFPQLDGIVDSFENIVPSDYYVQASSDSQATVSFLANAGNNKSTALKLDYSYSQPGCAFGMFASIGQDWSNYSSLEMWSISDQEAYIEIEIAEHDGDVWAFGWHDKPLRANEWEKLNANLTRFSRVDGRSIGDGKLSLVGFGTYRLTVCPTMPPSKSQHTILFDDIQLLK